MLDDYSWGAIGGSRKKPLKQVLLSVFCTLAFAPGFCWKPTWLSCGDLFAQLFERQTEEDAIHANGNFAPNFPVPEEMPREDPDGEKHLAVPLVKAAAPGNPSTSEAISISSDDEDEIDCQILDVIDALPLNWASAVVLKPTVVTKRAESRKRAASDTDAADDSGNPPKRSKPNKQTAEKPPRGRQKGTPTVDSGYIFFALC